jgi:hypothetical protein
LKAERDKAAQQVNALDVAIKALVIAALSRGPLGINSLHNPFGRDHGIRDD